MKNKSARLATWSRTLGYDRLRGIAVSSFRRVISLEIIVLALLLALTAVPLLAQVPQIANPKESQPAQNAPPPPHDPLDRTTPRDSIIQFIEACHERQYGKATRFMDLRQIPAGERDKQGSVLAMQLEDLLDDTSFDIATLSRNPEGDQGDSLAPNRDELMKVRSGQQTISLELERVELRNGLRVWVVSADSVARIPQAHQLLRETPIEKRLPQALVTHELLDTPVWRLIFLVGSALLIWILASLVAHGIRALMCRFTALTQVHAENLIGPVRLLLATSGLRAAIEFAPPSVIVRLYLQRCLTLVFFLALAWAGAVVVDIVAERWRTRLDPRMRAMTFSVLPLVRQILKLLLFLFAILTVLAAWGYNTTTLLAGLGVGGLAVALAAQKTIENLFGGLSVIGDRPVLVGDFCRFGDRVGNVIHIGLRSTRIRTLDRTIVSVPNSQFSTMELENFSARDKMWFHPTLKLRRDTTSDQLGQAVSSLREVLQKNPNVELGSVPVRFINIGDVSYDIEVFAYIRTPDFDEFLKIQQELLLQLMQAVERTGAGFAVPVVQNLTPGNFASSPRQDRNFNSTAA
jgi:MscS family membrane protein